MSAVADSIEIRWPSGIVQTLKNVKGDQQIQVDEPVVSQSAPPASKRCSALRELPPEAQMADGRWLTKAVFVSSTGARRLLSAAGGEVLGTP